MFTTPIARKMALVLLGNADRTVTEDAAASLLLAAEFTPQEIADNLTLALLTHAEPSFISTVSIDDTNQTE